MRKRTILSIIAVLVVLAAAFAVCAVKIYGSAIRVMDNLYKRLDELHASVLTDKDELHEAVYNLHHNYSFDYSWADDSNRLIAHALGGIDNCAYTNSLEAFLHNYRLGYRIFEVDLILSDESSLIAAHDEQACRMDAGLADDAPITVDTFMNTRVSGRYTPLDIRGIIELMAEYPDVYVITDTKYTDRASVLLQFSQLSRYAKASSPDVLHRIIPQIYHEPMLDWVMSVYPFKSIIYTLYAAETTPQEVLEFCEETGVGFITFPESTATPETFDLMDKNNIICAVHTVNDKAQSEKLMHMGIDMIYSDFLIPETSA